MNDTFPNNAPRRSTGCITAIAFFIGIALLAIVAIPILQKTSHEAAIRAEVAKIKADPSGLILALHPECVEALLLDAKCKERISEVLIFGDFVDVNDPRFHSLRNFPNLKTLRLEYCGLADEFVQGIQGAANVEDLSFHRSGVSEKGMRCILTLPKLKRLGIDHCTPPKCLQLLKGHAQIESFGLYEYEASIADLAFIKTLTNLRELTIDVSPKGDGAIDLHGLRHLTSLRLEGFLATDASLAAIEEMSDLAALCLNGAPITDAGLLHLKNCRKLKTLTLSSQSITDSGLAHLSRLTSLESLSLCNTKVTDAGLEHLKGLTSLRDLGLRFTQVTDQGIKNLQKALPQCKIQR